MTINPTDSALHSKETLKIPAVTLHMKVLAQRSESDASNPRTSVVIRNHLTELETTIRTERARKRARQQAAHALLSSACHDICTPQTPAATDSEVSESWAKTRAVLTASGLLAALFVLSCMVGYLVLI